MKLSVVLVAVVMMSVLDVTSSFLSKDKRGGVAASLHGNFHRSLHQPLFARAQGEDKRDWKDGVDKHKKSNPPTQKRFVDVLSTSWDSTDSWGQSDPWGNAWGDPWGDSSYNYYYYTWPKLRKRGVKTNQADKSIASTKRDEQTQKDDKVIKRGAKMDSKTKDKKTSQPLNTYATYQQPAYYYYYYQQQPNYQVQTSPYYYVITYPKRMMQRAFAAHKARRHLDDKDKKSVKDVAKVTDKKSKQDKADLDKKESQLMSALKRYMADDYKKK